MSQTSVLSGGQPIGVPGQLADSQEHDIVSGFNGEGAQVPFGVGLMKGPRGQGDFVLPTGASGTPGFEVSGVNIFSLSHNRAGTQDTLGNYSGDLGGSGLLPNASMQVGRKVRALVPVVPDVRDGDRAYCYSVATGTITRGVWCGSNMGGSFVRDCTTQGVFRSGTYTAADGTTRVAVLEYDSTNKAP